MIFKYTHASIGEIEGIQGDGIVQFLGVKYATVANRFAGSILTDYDPISNIINATKPGPYVLSPIQGLDAEFGFIQQSLPKPDGLTMSETEGLNLNITVPTSLENDGAIDIDRKLPVFVFVHGGGYAVGSNSWPQYDQGRLVKFSKELGMPVIGVGINYRLGVPGFLTSQELRDAGYPSNNGLRDQINALHWVKRYISGFGGDPENVTFGGESAGAVAGTLHLHSKELLFKRLLSMSGTSLMLPPIPPPVTEFAYSATLQALSLEQLSASERVNALLNVPAEDILTKIGPGVPLLPALDGDFIPSALSFSQLEKKGGDLDTVLPGSKWCSDLLIGDCQFDASIFGSTMPSTENIAHRFIVSLTNTLHPHPSTLQKLLSTYNISTTLPNNIALKNILQFATDISFFAPTITFATAWAEFNGKANIYHFNEPNPWNGPWKGEATHILDVAHLFLNFEEYLGEDEKKVERAFAGDVLGFVNGKVGWKAFVGEENVRVYGRGRGGTAESVKSGNRGRKDVLGVAAEGSGRRKLIFEVAEGVGLDLLAGAWGNFFVGK